MKERTGGSRTRNQDGKIVDIVEPPATHPEGHRARDAHGRPLDELSRKQSAPQPTAAAPETRRRARPEATE